MDRKKRGMRRLEISSKLVNMGHALKKEGTENKDYEVSQTGNFLVLIGRNILSDTAVDEFTLISSMFSSKIILQNIEHSDSAVGKFLKDKLSNETYEEFKERVGLDDEEDDRLTDDEDIDM